MVPSYIRIAAGTCVLVLGVMVGVPGTAFADPDTGDAAAASGDAVAASGDEVAEETATTPDDPTDSAAAAERNAVEGVASTLGSGREPGDPVPTSVDSLTEEPAVTTSTSDDDSDVVAADSDPVPSESESNTNSSEPVAPGTTEAEPAATYAASVPEEATPVNTDAPGPAAPASAAPVPATPPPATTVTPPVPYEVRLGASVMMPVWVVLTATHYLLKAAVVIPLAVLRFGIASYFAITGVAPGVDNFGRAGAGLSNAAGTSLGSALSSATPFAGPSNVTSAAEAIRFTPLGAIAASAMDAPQATGAPSQGPAVSPTDNSTPADVQSFIRDVAREILSSPSLMALTLVALPGLGGLLIITAAGVRLGYRQAKASVAVYTEGIGRFARTGPVGVVRSESLVFVRPRASGSRTLKAVPLLSPRTSGSRTLKAVPLLNEAA